MKCWTLTIGFLSVLVVVAAYVGHAREELRYNSEAERQFVDSWMQKLLKKRSGRLTTFKYNNCGDPTKETANITKLIIGPDPLYFPGPLTVEFAGTSKITVQAPITGVLLLQVKAGSTWVKIPCIGVIGSCTYEDICQLLNQIQQCPGPLIDAGIPCKCPFPQGPYNLPQSEFDIEAAIFPPGDYHAVANVTNSGNFVGCVELFVTFS